MSEYRRFVAYFYEYADGKKQQNAGFAKVELRDGMWRVLFRLTIPNRPEPPLRVYGFVRENGYLQGFLLGTMAAGGTAPEEWAWRADTPVGLEKYLFGEMNGMRIESGDGRSFFTVWDDEAMDPARFVLEIPQSESMPQEKEEVQPELMPREEEEPQLEEPEQVLRLEESEQPSQPEEPEQEPIPENPAQPLPQEEPEQPPHPVEPSQTEIPAPESVELPAPQITEMPQPEIPVISEPDVPEMPSQMPAEMPNPAENLLRSRQRFRPFQDGEFTDCVQIKLCDILPLQQENWKVGRSNFLQHGYYLYRHLLLGRTKDGGYILGVPGMRNQQEEYMAQTFGYDHFKQSGSNSYGRKFGYWYRILREPEQIRDRLI
ncbi:MAG: hypothetical protein LIO99_06245 [Clostridiales bacterium]|nr:hypothetical protein [Clostridiales bacterium]